MATDLEKLVVQLSADIKGYQREMLKAQGITNKQATAIEKRYRRMNKNLDSIGRNAANSLIAPLTGVAAALSVREVARYADSWTRAGNVIAAAGQIAGTAGRDLEGINEIATKTRAGFSETAELYARILRSTAGVAKSELEVARATEVVNKAFKAGGAAASEMSAGILQLSQGLGSGMLQGDELRSVRENAPILAQAIADYFDTTIGGLKELGAEGELTSDKIFKAILAAQPKVEAAFAATSQTIEDGITRVRNAMTQYIGQTDEGLSASQRLAVGLNALADNFDQTADVVLKVAAVIAGALVGRSLTAMIAKLGLGVAALAKFTAAIRAAGSVASISTAMAGLGAAAGPVGMVIGGAVVGALTLFASSSDEASAAARTYEEALEAVRVKAEETAPAIEGAADAIDEKMRNQVTGGIEKATEEINRFQRDAVAALSDYAERINSGPEKIITDSQLQSVIDLRDELEKDEKSAKEVEQALYSLANSNPNMQRLADGLSPLLKSLYEAVAAAGLLQDKLAQVASTPSPRSAEDASMDSLREMERVGKQFLDEAQRRNSLTRDQLSLEKEIAQVRKDAEKAGAVLTEGQIRSLAQDNLAADERRSKSGRSSGGGREKQDVYEREADQIARYTAALVAETEAQRQLNPLIDDYGYAVERARIQQDLLNAAKEQGKEITPALREQINQLAHQYATATVEAGKLAEEQDKIREKAEELAEFNKDLARGIIDGFIEGKDAADIFADALKKVGDRLINDVLDGLFQIQNMKGGIGGIIGMLGNLFGFSGGGFVGGISGTAMSAVMGGAGGLYDKGGYTGAGGKYQPAGVVHKGEYVFSKAAVDRIGVGNLEAMHRNLKGYAEGGFVAPSAPVLRAVPAASPGATYAPQYNIDASGAEAGVEKKITAALREYDKTSYQRWLADQAQARKRNAA